VSLHILDPKSRDAEVTGALWLVYWSAMVAGAIVLVGVWL
jgi:hypothetical protein